MKPKLIVFTDMDGTLLDHDNYSWHAAADAIEQLNQLNIPIICNTSKTYSEVSELHQSIGLNAPFIVENGSAIYVNQSNHDHSEPTQPMHLLGAKRADILHCLALLKQQGFKFIGFNDWDTKQIAEQTGLSLAEAKLSSERSFSEPLIWQDSEANKLDFIHKLKEYGYTALQGGRFLSIQGQCDKGKALNWLNAFYQQQWQSPTLTIALGDSGNDVAMLNAADIAVWIKSAKPFPQLNKIEQVYRSTKMGPEGWQEIMAHLLHKYN